MSTTTMETQQGETAPKVAIDVAKGEGEWGGESSDDYGTTDRGDEFEKIYVLFIIIPLLFSSSSWSI